jgi:hypothetical protein
MAIFWMQVSSMTWIVSPATRFWCNSNIGCARAEKRIRKLHLALAFSFSVTHRFGDPAAPNPPNGAGNESNHFGHIRVPSLRG